MRKRTPQKKEMDNYQEKRNKCENRELSCKEISTFLSIQDQSSDLPEEKFTLNC